MEKKERWTSTSPTLRLNSIRAVVPSSTTCFAAAAAEAKLKRANKHKMVTRSKNRSTAIAILASRQNRTRLHAPAVAGSRARHYPTATRTATDDGRDEDGGVGRQLYETKTVALAFRRAVGAPEWPRWKCNALQRCPMRACLLRLVVLLFTASQESRLVDGLGALQHYRYDIDMVGSLKTQLHTEEESTTHAMTDRLFCDIRSLQKLGTKPAAMINSMSST